MKRKVATSIKLFIGLLLMSLGSYAQDKEAQVKITAIRSGKGGIVLNVFKDQATYDKEQPFKKFVFDKKALANGSITVKINLPPGIYGITLLDDENEDGKIDKNLIGIPKEGFGFSNFFMEKMKKPSFDEFKVDFSKPLAPIVIKVKYM